VMTANILEIHGLVSVVSRHPIINQLDFAIEEGELRVLVGPNGAGKTTLIDLITGRHRPTAGQILFKGQRIDGRARHEIYRLGISRKFQVPTVYDNLTVFENMSIGLRGHRSVFSSLGYRMTSAAVEQIERVLVQVKLLERAREEAFTLSHGEKQWLEIGMVVASDPQLLFLDEPTTGMTREETNATARLIRDIAKTRSVMVVEHDMSFVRQIARTITVLHQGRKLAEGSVREVEDNPKVAEVYLGKVKISAVS
jgi:urea transport system ATP-binding protein